MRFVHEQFIPLPRERVFAFHENPANLALIQQTGPRFELLSHGENLQPGSQTWVNVYALGVIPMRMGFEHFVYEPPGLFGERMIRGPLRTFEHRHGFEEHQGGTLLRDEIEVGLPWYLGGELVTHLFMAPMLRKVFRARGQSLLKLAEEGKIG